MDRRSLLILSLFGVPLGASLALAQPSNAPEANRATGPNRSEENTPDPQVDDDDDDDDEDGDENDD